MIKAVIFISPDEREDRTRAREGLDHTERRGYWFVAMLKDWDQTLDLLRRRLLSTIVFPGRTLRRPTAAVADEDTQPIGRWALAPDQVGPYRAHVSMNPDRVWELNEPASAASLYETARLLPRGDDGGFAEAFLRSRHTRDS